MKKIYRGLGRRKSSVARVTLTKGTGKITINKRDIENYFPYKTLIQNAVQGLDITENIKTFDITANIKGGGYSGQSGALRHGIVRALIEFDPEYKKALKAKKLTTRDSRIKERKKPGLKKARKSKQFSKR